MTSPLPRTERPLWGSFVARLCRAPVPWASQLGIWKTAVALLRWVAGRLRREPLVTPQDCVEDDHQCPVFGPNASICRPSAFLTIYGRNIRGPSPIQKKWLSSYRQDCSRLIRDNHQGNTFAESGPFRFGPLARWPAPSAGISFA